MNSEEHRGEEVLEHKGFVMFKPLLDCIREGFGVGCRIVIPQILHRYRLNSHNISPLRRLRRDRSPHRGLRDWVVLL